MNPYIEMLGRDGYNAFARGGRGGTGGPRGRRREFPFSDGASGVGRVLVEVSNGHWWGWAWSLNMRLHYVKMA